LYLEKNRDKKLFIHIGIAKSATTWLQNILFPDQLSINYLGKTDRNYPSWMIDWAHLDDFEFEKKQDYIKNDLHRVLNAGVNLISSESFTNKGSIHNLAYRIKSIAPSANIIITIRDPIDTIISHYKLYVKQAGYYKELDNYLEFGRRPRDIVYRKPIYVADYIYDDMIELYNELFKSNVLVLKYEDMVAKYESFIAELSNFLNVDLEIRNAKSKDKINVGNNTAFIQKMRIENLYKELSALCNLDVKTGITRHYIEKFINEAFINDTIRSEIILFLAGRCHGYY